VMDPVRHARAGGHSGAVSRIVRDYWMPAFAGMTIPLFFW
jgi:hypothetical protein